MKLLLLLYEASHDENVSQLKRKDRHLTRNRGTSKVSCSVEITLILVIVMEQP